MMWEVGAMSKLQLVIIKILFFQCFVVINHNFFPKQCVQKNICSYVVTVRQGGKGVCVCGGRALSFLSHKRLNMSKCFYPRTQIFFAGKHLWALSGINLIQIKIMIPTHWDSSFCVTRYNFVNFYGYFSCHGSIP